ncbi:MAG TPA: SUMF1/EgtB/PvdO family nonheme iron enzyme, partial [Myxococcota bacterium]|nr:SUMF1/EgtB/PvdO family nonheme iron enzyme [Myxococcota bacterium]
MSAPAKRKHSFYRLLKLLAGLAMVALLPNSCVQERCYEDQHCPGLQICGSNGKCTWRCVKDEDCGLGFECVNHECSVKQITPTFPDFGPGNDTPMPDPVPTCPEGMVLIENNFCIDTYEAARVDATAVNYGRIDEMGLPRPGVMPWMVKDNATADAACKAAGKELCTPVQWEFACKGPAKTVYAYADAYDPAICNGLDTFCDCDGKCKSVAICPYVDCYGKPSPAQDGGPCGASFHPTPTGAFPDCTNAYGVFDMNGNLWEHVAGGNDKTVRGGAFNCSDSKQYHRCDYIPTNWTPSALGFRCCTPVTWRLPDSGDPIDPVDVIEPKDTWSDESGCLDPDFDVPTDTQDTDETEGGCLDPDLDTPDPIEPDDQGGCLDPDADSDTDSDLDTQPDTDPDLDIAPDTDPD